jgi:hypothetical protein
MFDKINNILVSIMIVLVAVGMWWILVGGGALGSPSLFFQFLLWVTE